VFFVKEFLASRFLMNIWKKHPLLLQISLTRDCAFPILLPASSSEAIEVQSEDKKGERL